MSDKPSYTIDEMFKEKHQIENDISNMIAEFTDKYKLKVESISVMNDYINLSKGTFLSVDAKLNLKG